jgi:hypothetical protein
MSTKQTITSFSMIKPGGQSLQGEILVGTKSKKEKAKTFK